MLAAGAEVLPLARPSQTQQQVRQLPRCLWRIYGLCFKVKVSAIAKFFLQGHWARLKF